ncbi:Ger(x)C family spore germination protein [Paenibacillus sp. OK003]|uniref:Ger(x)C family spore germination protein n=1 Tax=Paenibacillus sp. OK003 TaxID=1884380 RepID=UPI0008D8890E|nr:Ger(x)C family spore germination protein [Paenibacillus sp. OK003]SEL46683.1 spore germination protein [Paenibacillus sp. OK003]
MSRKVRLALLLPGLMLLLFTSGCWSSKEIEDLSVYVGLGLDMAKETEFEKSVNEQGGHYPKRNNITATVQIVPKGSSKEESQQGSPGAGKSYFNEQLTGDSVIQIFRQFSLRRDRPLIGHHLKVIVVSSEVARKFRLDQLLDFVLRDNDIRPSCLVVVSDRRALDALTSNDPSEIPSFYLTGLVDNVYRTNKILPPVSLAKLDATMQSGSSYLLQNVISYEGEHKFSGAAIFSGKTNRWIGSLNQTDMEGLSWIQGKAIGGVVKTYTPKDGSTITYEIKHIKSKIIPTVKGDDISFHVQIESDGWFMENWTAPEAKGSERYLDGLEKDFSHMAEQQVEELLHKMQHVYKVDAAGFSDKLRIKYPRVWKKIKNNWDETFSEVPITYDIKIKITNQGSSTE